MSIELENFATALIFGFGEDFFELFGLGDEGAINGRKNRRRTRLAAQTVSHEIFDHSIWDRNALDAAEVGTDLAPHELGAIFEHL